jgi:hypothetical protein
VLAPDQQAVRRVLQRIAVDGVVLLIVGAVADNARNLMVKRQEPQE